MEPKEQGEQSSNGSEVTPGQMHEMEVTGGEQESSNGTTCQQRKGGSLSCVSICQSVLPANALLTSVSSSSLLNSPDSAVSAVQSQSRLTAAVYWVCGMERRKKGDDDPVARPAPVEIISSLEEKPRLRLVVNVNLLICLSVTAFIIGYWV